VPSPHGKQISLQPTTTPQSHSLQQLLTPQITQTTNNQFKTIKMMFTKQILAIAAIAALGQAQSTGAGSCDPQNDNNNDATCTGSGVAVITNTNTITTGTGLPTRVSLTTGVDTNVIVITSRSTDVGTTSLPHSLYVQPALCTPLLRSVTNW